MSKEDFDVDSMAAYLHLTPQQIRRLADRGRLPGRKVGGNWRFNPSEIHHWLERRIGASDVGELAAVEDALERSAIKTGGPSDAPSLVSLLPVEAIAIPLTAKTRSSVINAMVELAAGTGWLWDPEKMTAAVKQREEMHSTALENGVALLHPRRPLAGILERAFLALGRTGQGIPFGGGNLTDVFFLVCSTDDNVHLRVLARLSRVIAEGDFLTRLRAAPDAVAAYQLIDEFEAGLNK